MNPKKQSLEAAEASLATQLAKLHEKQAMLKEVTDKLNNLEDNLAVKQDEKKVRIFYFFFIKCLLVFIYTYTFTIQEHKPLVNKKCIIEEKIKFGQGYRLCACLTQEHSFQFPRFVKIS